MLNRIGSMLDAFGFHYASRDTVAWIRDDLLGSRGLTPAIWDTEAYGNTEVVGADRMFIGWLDERAEGTARLFHFVYHLPYFPTAQSEYPWIARFGQFPVNADYTPRAHAFGLRTLSDVVGDKELVTDFCVANALWGYAFRDGDRAVLAITRPGAATWSPADGITVRFRLPHRTHEVVVTDLMGNRRTLTADRRKRIDVPMSGAVTFVEGIAFRRITGLRFKGYVGPDGKLEGKGLARRRQQCDASQLGFDVPRQRR
jgi:hypothetical protein